MTLVDEPHAVRSAHQIAADRRRRRAQSPPQRAIDRTRVPEVVAHEAFDLLARRRAGIPETLSGALLELVAEEVVMPPGFEMENRSDAQ